MKILHIKLNLRNVWLANDKSRGNWIAGSWLDWPFTALDSENRSALKYTVNR